MKLQHKPRVVAMAATLLLLSLTLSCAGLNTTNQLKDEVSDLQIELDSTRIELSLLEKMHSSSLEEMQALNQSVTKLSQELDWMHSKYGLNFRDSSLNVTTPKLRIRSSPEITEGNIIAIAKEGAHLKIVSYADYARSWYRIEYLIYRYPHIGYVYNDSEYHKTVKFDPIIYMKQDLVVDRWADRISKEMESAHLDVMGIYVAPTAHDKRGHFRKELLQLFQDYQHATIELDNFDLSSLKSISDEKKLEAVLTATFDPSLEHVVIDLYDCLRERNLYSTTLPFNAIDLSVQRF